MHFLPMLLACALPVAQDTPIFKIEAHYIKVPVTVFDVYGKVLTHLTQEDFRLFDEAEPRFIENFVLDRTPLHILLLLDASRSVYEEIVEIKKSAFLFARSFTKEDRIAIISFSDKIVLLQDWTNNLRQIQKSLSGLEQGYRTALYDALFMASREQLRHIPGKKVIIVLTDGLDNESEVTYEAVIDSLIQDNIALYIVSRTRLVKPQIEQSKSVEFLNNVMKNVLCEDKDFVGVYFKEKETALNYLAGTTGGRVFFPAKLEELKESYAELAQELKNQYILTFRPPRISPKEFRTIEVVCTQTVGRIHHRKLYHIPSLTRR